METKNNEESSKKRVAVIEPPLKVELVSPKKTSLPLCAQWVGLVVPIILSIWALCLTISDKSQNDLLEKLTAMAGQQNNVIQEIKKTNESIGTTQKNTYNLLQATLQQNEDFKKVNKPIVRLRLQGSFFSLPRNEETGSCLSIIKYYVENQGFIPAKDFSGRVGFISDLGGEFTGFYGHTPMYGETRDLVYNDPIKFGPDSTDHFSCDIAGGLYDCFVVFAYQYYNEITSKLIKDTLVYRHRSSELFQRYYMKPLEGEDLSKRSSIINAFLQGGFYPVP